MIPAPAVNYAFQAVVGVTWLANVPATDSLGPWAQWGLAGIVISYVMWRDNEREKRMAKEGNEDKKYSRDVLEGLIERNTEAMEALIKKGDG